MLMTDETVGNMTDTHAVVAMTGMLRRFIQQRCRIEVCVMGNLMQQCALLAEAEQKGQY